jgi:UDP-glucose 4-epimerase
MSHPPIALITGATGSIGPTLVAHLRAAGYAVRAFSRHAPPPGLLPPDVPHFPGDVADPAALAPALAGADMVFHLAALLHVETPAPELAAAYERVNVIGTRTVAEAAARAGARRLVLFSTVKVYGEVSGPEPVTEATPPRPSTPYGRSKLAGEAAALGTAGIETVVLRLSAVYGPGLRGSWGRMTGAIRRGWFVPIGRLDNRRCLTHVADVARAASFAAESPGLAGGVYNLVGHEGATLRAILDAMYAAAGRSLPPLRFPAWAALSGAWLGERLLGERFPLKVDAVRHLVEDEVYSGAALRALGFTPSVSLAEGWRGVMEAGQPTPAGRER